MQHGFSRRGAAGTAVGTPERAPVPRTNALVRARAPPSPSSLSAPRPATHQSPRAALPGARAGALALRRFPLRKTLARIQAVNPTRLRALLENVQAVRDAISNLEQEITAALAEHRAEAASPQRPSDDEWLTLAELAAWLKVGRTTLYRLITSGAVPSFRVGRSVRVRRADVERWLEDTRQDLGG